jgi:hypothetical protein
MKNQMKKIIFVLMIIGHFTKINGQILDSLIVKTHPLRDAVALNPNIGIEKILNDKFSFELLFTYKNRDTEFSGKDFDIWSYKRSSGYRIQSSLKRYFVKSKKIPYSWYILGQLGFSVVNLSNFNEKYRSGEYFRTVNINKKRVEFNVLFGREIHIYKNFLTEFNFGVGIIYEKYWSKLISGNNNDNRFKNGQYESDYLSPILYGNWTIGYLIKRKTASP